MEALLCEHDRQTRNTLHLVLSQHGYGVTICHDEVEFWVRARDHGFDLAIIGLQSGGVDVLEQVASAANQCPTSVLLILPIEHSRVAAARQLGEAPNILYRPVSIPELRQRLRTIEHHQVHRIVSGEGNGVRDPATSHESAPTIGWRPPVERAESQSEAWFRAFIQYATDLFAIIDPAGTLLYVSPSVEALTGYAARELVGSDGFRIIHPDDRDSAWSNLSDSLAMPGTTIAPIDLRLYRRDGTWRWYEIRATNLLDVANVNGVVIHARDIEDRRSADEALRRSEERFRALVQHASDMVAVVTLDGTVAYQSPTIERDLGLAPETITGDDLERFVYPEDQNQVRAAIEEIRDVPGGSTRLDLWLQHPDGSWRSIDVVCTNLIHNPSVGGIVVNARETTDRKSLERQLTRLAFFDALTGLPNRALFLHRLGEALDRIDSVDTRVAVLFVDLDQFKVVNDSLGHDAGDRLLTAIGERLRQIVRPGDTIARLGGDEFIVLLDDIEHHNEAAAVANRMISGVEAPITLDHQEVSVSASVGIALSNRSTGDSHNLVRNADIALYRAKAAGRGQYVIFHDGMAAQAVERLKLENRLRRAVQDGQFSLRYFPELDLRTGRLAGLEILLRWQDPVHGLIMPGDFMEIATETGLIVPIGRWVFEHACQQVRQWHDIYPDSRELVLALNLSAREFQQPDLLEFIVSTLDRYQISPERVRLEIAETVMADELRLAREKLQALQDHGLQLAIDDFGVGYTSLSYLTQTSFDILKIDPEFVSGPGGVENNLSIVQAVTSLAHALGMAVTAAGIESREQLQRIRSAGCDYGQGMFFTQPLTATEVETRLFSDEPE